MKIEFQDRIDDYLLNRMTDEERQAFESEVADNAEMKEQLSFTESVQHTVKSRNEKLAAMEEWEEDYHWKDESEIEVAAATECRPTGSGYSYCPAPPREAEKAARHTPTRRILYWGSGIAAVFVVGFFLFQNLYLYDATPDIMTSPMESTMRSGGDFSEIEMLLKQKKISEALAKIEQETLVLKDDSTRLSQDVGLDEEKTEYKMLEIQAQQEELTWLKVQTYLGLDRKEDAIMLLDKLRQSGGIYQLSADSLYHILK